MLLILLIPNLLYCSSPLDSSLLPFATKDDPLLSFSIPVDKLLIALSKLLSLSPNLLSIFSLVILVTYLFKEWKIFAFLKELLIVISPIFFGLIIAWLFDPLVRKLQNKKIPRIIGCFISYIIVLSIIILVGYLFIPSFTNQIKDFASAIPDILDDLTDFIARVVNRFDTNNTINISKLKKQIISTVTDYSTGLATNIPKYALSIGKSIVSVGVNFGLGLMVGFYLLYDFNKINGKIESVLPINWRDNYNELVQRINTSLRSYVQGVLIVMLLVFLTQSIGLTLAGLKAPLVFALFCAVTDIIPYFGPYIGGIPAVIVGFTISPITGICVLISIIIVQLLENNFYQPLIMGHTMKLHPVTIMLGLLIFQHFFGIIGMVVATPVIACLKILFIFINEKLNILGKITGEKEILEKNK